MYKIKDVAMMTGLTDRTLRNYLKAGILQGTKEEKNGESDLNPKKFLLTP